MVKNSANAQYSMYSIIDKKKNGGQLSENEIKWTISALMDNNIHDYQMSALLMAIFINGMTKEETQYLTDAMLYSGKVLTFSEQNVVDKHSTGGIGDKASFVLGPIAAACGVKVPMIAGRGLGFTGGTVDKVEAIKGFNTSMKLDEFSQLLQKRGMVLIGQTSEIAPADRVIYALRDVTATIDSIPLITASIMSKKLAEGANGIVMDIKLGSGAFMRSKAKARKLGKSIIDTAHRFDKKCIAVISDMNQPLGNCVGHSLEIIESIKTLKGEGPKDLTELSVTLAAHMIVLAGIEKSFSKAQKRAKQSIKDGSALKKFEELIRNQGGDTSVIKNYNKLPLALKKTDVISDKNGYIKTFINDQIGFSCTELGGGRKVKTDKIDFGVGFEFHKKIGDQVKKGDSILTIYHNSGQENLVKKISDKFLKTIIKVSANKVAKNSVIIETLKP